MHRRRFLAASLTSAAMGLASARAAAAPDGVESVKLAGIFERMYEAWLDASPEGVTDLGLDSGRRSAARARLDSRSRAADEDFLARMRGFVGELAAIDAKGISEDQATYRDIVVAHLGPALAGARAHPFGVRGDSVPFMLSQFSGVQPYVLGNLNGAYAGLPDFLINKHAINAADDADAYVARIAALGLALDEETARAREDADRHAVVPPTFIIDRAIQQMSELRDQAANATPVVQNLSRRVRDLGLAEEASARGAEAFDQTVRPALARQVELMARLHPRSSSEAGVWKLKDGDAYYAWALAMNTSLDLPADEIHRIGLHQVAELSAQADAELRAQGYGNGSVGERLRALAQERRFQFSDDARGKAQILELFRTLTNRVTERLPRWFANLPDSDLRIEAVPAALEASAPRGYYQRGTIDGSRPGIYFVNLSSTRAWSRFNMPTFAFHEGVPGHHLQFSLALRGDMPDVLRLLQFAGFSEGWALYAEELAGDMGLYEDPFTRIGFLQSMLFRAARLVTDTGIHHRRWSRERAIRYVAETVGETEQRSASEVDRYVSWPGQACSYKLGHKQWIDLRDRTRSRLGGGFDIRSFHHEALRRGPMPFEVLGRTMDRWGKT